jgi:serine/threonine protein phosphatase PrpC
MEPKIRVTSTYDWKRKTPEDVCLTNLPIIGVLDCHAGINPFSGQLVRDIILKESGKNCLFAKDLKRGIYDINFAIEDCQRDVEPYNRAGAVFALARIMDKSIRIIQGGDSLIFWRTKSGETGEISFTPDQYYQFDQDVKKNFFRLMKKYHNDETKVWPEHQGLLAETRRKHANIHYAVLNGDSAINRCWFEREIPIDSLDTLILLTDGVITGLVEEYEDFRVLVERIIKLLKTKGVGAVLDWTRDCQREKLRNSHAPYPEATIVAVRFS